jgi:hypothetical protein
MRQKRVHESASGTCIFCPFALDQATRCFVPGGTCVLRGVDGVPGHYVGDILVNTGQMPQDWLERVFPSKGETP